MTIIQVCDTEAAHPAHDFQVDGNTAYCPGGHLAYLDRLYQRGLMTTAEYEAEVAAQQQGDHCGDGNPHAPHDGCTGTTIDEWAAEEDPEYVKFCEEQARMCHASYITGGHDPYGTECDLDRGHADLHEGDDPFGNGGRVRWGGGGMCAGDPLPYRHVEWIDPGGPAVPPPPAGWCAVYGYDAPAGHVGVPLTVAGALCCDRAPAARNWVRRNGALCLNAVLLLAVALVLGAQTGLVAYVWHNGAVPVLHVYGQVAAAVWRWL